jgi:hypothetical protein
MGGHDQIKRPFAAVCKPLRKRGNQVGALKDVTDCDEMGATKRIRRFMPARASKLSISQ